MSAPAVTGALRRFLPEKVAESLTANKPGNLYQVLARKPVSKELPQKVYQLRWASKEIYGSYWLVTGLRLKPDGKHGTAWGTLHWKGQPVKPYNTKVKGALKYTWAEGESAKYVPPSSKPKQETIIPEHEPEGANRESPIL